MTVFWLLNFIPPAMANALQLPVQASGSWIMALQDALASHPVRLILCGYSNAVDQPQRREIDGTIYLALPQSGGKAALQDALQQEQPDLLQIFGTENDHSVWALELFPPEKTLLYIQGLAGPCGEHMADGLPPRFLRRQPLKEKLAHATGGGTVYQLKQQLLARAKTEQQAFAQARYVLGRTDWDREFSTAINKNVEYFPLNEIMREPFYEGGWQRDAIRAPRIFISQGNIPLKGLHRLLEALPLIAARYPDIQVYVAGWPPPQKGPLLTPLMHWLSEYSGYLAKLAKRLQVQDRIHYTGVLNAASMKGRFLESSVFVLPSSIENSPNSLGEAMLLGMPCVAASVGGVPSMLTHQKEGLLFDPSQPEELAQAILTMFDDPHYAESLGKAARARALQDHNAATIAAQQMAYYRRLLGKDV